MAAVKLVYIPAIAPDVWLHFSRVKGSIVLRRFSETRCTKVRELKLPDYEKLMKDPENRTRLLTRDVKPITDIKFWYEETKR
jgi:hypothetical protein